MCSLGTQQPWLQQHPLQRLQQQPQAPGAGLCWESQLLHCLAVHLRLRLLLLPLLLVLLLPLLLLQELAQCQQQEVPQPVQAQLP